MANPTLKKIIEDLFDDIGEFQFEDLHSSTQDVLRAAYIEENEDIIYDLFANVHETSLAHHFAALARNRCDTQSLADDIRIAIVNGKDLPNLINVEATLQWREYQRERDVEYADFLREDR